MPRVVRFHETGAPDVLRVEDIDVPAAKAGEVRIQVAAFGLNRAEVMMRAGQYVATPEFPSRLGYEAAGIIESVGPGVTDFQVGDRVGVVPFLSSDSEGRWTGDSAVHGTYGELAVLPAEMVAHNPDNVSDLDCAAMWMQYVTAWGGIVKFAKVQAGETVLVTAGSSSAALGALQIAKAEGASVIATTRTGEKKSFLLEAGADHVIVTDEEDIAEAGLALTGGRGVDVIYDPVGGPNFEAFAKVTAPMARIVNFGVLERGPAHFDVLTMLAKRIVIRFHSIFDTARFPEQRERAKSYVYERAGSGVLKPIIDRVFPLDQIAEAHRHMESTTQRGKIVVTT